MWRKMGINTWYVQMRTRFVLSPYINATKTRQSTYSYETRVFCQVYIYVICQVSAKYVISGEADIIACVHDIFMYSNSEKCHAALPLWQFFIHWQYVWPHILEIYLLRAFHIFSIKSQCGGIWFKDGWCMANVRLKHSIVCFDNDLCWHIFYPV